MNPQCTCNGRLCAERGGHFPNRDKVSPVQCTHARHSVPDAHMRFYPCSFNLMCTGLGFISAFFIYFSTRFFSCQWCPCLCLSVGLSVCLPSCLSVFLPLCVCVCPETDMQTLLSCSPSYSQRQGLSVDSSAHHFSEWSFSLLLWGLPVSVFPEMH